MSKHGLRGACAALVALSMGAAGCAPLPPADPGPDGVYFRGRGAESIVQGDLPVLSTLTRAVLADMGVTVGTREADVNDLDLEIRGTSPHGRAVHVELEEDADGNTRVRATARMSAAEWDREYARIIVERIVERLSREGQTRLLPGPLPGRLAIPPGPPPSGEPTLRTEFPPNRPMPPLPTRAAGASPRRRRTTREALRRPDRGRSSLPSFPGEAALDAGLRPVRVRRPGNPPAPLP